MIRRLPPFSYAAAEAATEYLVAAEVNPDNEMEIDDKGQGEVKDAASADSATAPQVWPRTETIFHNWNLSWCKFTEDIPIGIRYICIGVGFAIRRQQVRAM